MNATGYETSIDQERQKTVYISAAILILLVLLFCQILALISGGASNSGQDHLPLSIRATSRADYGPGTGTFVVPPVKEDILLQIITDLQGTGDPKNRIATLEVNLSTPVPTMTLDSKAPTSTVPPATPTILPSATPQATVTPTVQPTLTSTIIYVTPSPTSSISTPIAQPTAQPKPTRKPTKTKKPK
ncbi:MAG: hypothetical protein HXY35_11875 [Chloroflexi bacterium]|nr:hypothetical protein [Chloroflexota bacterium]